MPAKRAPTYRSDNPTAELLRACSRVAEAVVTYGRAVHAENKYDKQCKRKRAKLAAKHPEQGLDRPLKGAGYEIVFSNLTPAQRKEMEGFSARKSAEVLASATQGLTGEEHPTELRLEGLIWNVASDFSLQAEKIQMETVALVLFLATLKLAGQKIPGEAEMVQIAIAAGLDPALHDPRSESEREKRRVRWRGVWPTDAYLDGITQSEDIESLTWGALDALRRERDRTRPRRFKARR